MPANCATPARCWSHVERLLGERQRRGTLLEQLAAPGLRLAELRAETEAWCRELLEKSPTALALAKQSFNVDSEQRAGVAQFAGTALNLYDGTDEAMEGRNAFVEKRPVDFRKFRR